MRTVVTPAQMAAVDAAAADRADELIERAGSAVYRAARRMLGGTYGRRAIVLYGPGNNGADGLVAARQLSHAGVRVRRISVNEDVEALAGADLIIDAAFGTGLSRPFHPPPTDGAPVLAVDIPSGVDGLTGQPLGGPLRANATVTFAALKPGLLIGPGAELAGHVELVDIGLNVGQRSLHLVDDDDVAKHLHLRPVDAHKWKRAIWAFAGCPDMRGAGRLVAEGALRAGATYVRQTSTDADPLAPTEVVSAPLDASRWPEAMVAQGARFAAAVIGPGLSRADGLAAAVHGVLRRAPVPVVVDGDAITLLGRGAAAVLNARTHPTVITPHDGEFETLTGARPGTNRLSAAQTAASELGSIVLLKGPTTVVAAPDGATLLVRAGDPRLATAGTGDVLSGMIAAFLASGTDPLWAAALGAHVHGRAAAMGLATGFVARDLPSLVARWLSDLLGEASAR